MDEEGFEDCDNPQRSEDMRADEDCEHVWHYIEDWEGDPTLHNGTNDLSHWECELCGATKHKSFKPYDFD